MTWKIEILRPYAADGDLEITATTVDSAAVFIEEWTGLRYRDIYDDLRRDLEFQWKNEETGAEVVAFLK